jgi:L,D-transpeptidase YcbB
VRSLALASALLLSGVASIAHAGDLWVPRTASWHAQPSTADEIKSRVEQLRTTGVLRVAGRRIERRALLLDVYERRGFQPLWTHPSAVHGLARAIEAAGQHGLVPEHYHRSLLSAGLAAAPPSALWSGAEPSPDRVADLDLLRTDAFVRLSRHLRFGRVDPEGPSSGVDISWPFGGPDALDSLVAVVSSGRVEEALAGLPPRHFVYQGLVAALADVRTLAATGAWETIPDGPTLRRDSTDTRVPALRRRLGLLPPFEAGEDPDTLRFDAMLEAAVTSFQHRHGLNEDGLVGAATRSALNVPMERRIDQLRVNLERARWVAHQLPDTFVAVNVAGARVYVLNGDSVVFETRGIVGTEYTRTPLFSAPMLYVDLNPTWTVPASVAGEVLDALREDSTYLERQGIRVLDGSGREVDPSGIEFSRYTGRTFPYVFRQDPGPHNALGEIKLMFPNEHSVYLHDTPSRGLFAQEERLFSHGCIRVQNPLGLAEVVLGDPERWNRETLRAAIDEGVTRTIPLEDPMPVYVLYWTASVDLHGELHFYRDVYRRDAAILTGLDTDDGG